MVYGSVERAMVVTYGLSIVTIALSLLGHNLPWNVSDDEINRGWVTLRQIWGGRVDRCKLNFNTICESLQWRVGIRRVCGLSSNAHSVLLPLVCCRLPLYDELMKFETFAHFHTEML